MIAEQVVAPQGGRQDAGVVRECIKRGIAADP